MPNAIVAMTTTNSEREARELAGLFVKGRLAAGVQIIPKVHSIYEWEGEVRDDMEYLLLIITREELIGKLKKAVADSHSYEVPEFLVLPVIDSSEDYMQWMCDVTK